MRTPRARILPARRPWWLARRRFRSGMRIDDTNIEEMRETPKGLLIRTGRGVYLIVGDDLFTVRPA